MINIIEIDERDTKRALQFVVAHIEAARGENGALTKVLDQMRHGELNAVRTMAALSETVMGLMAANIGVERVDDHLATAIARLTARCDQLDAAEAEDTK